MQPTTIKIYSAVLVTILVIFVTASVYAQVGITGSGPNSGITGSGPTPSNPPAASNQPTFTLSNPLKVNSIGELVQNFVEIFSYIVILIAVVAFIFIGFKYILYSAQGNVSKISELHQQLLWLVIGVAVVIGARVIIQLVINTLGATGTVSPGVIQSANNAIQPH